MKKTLTVFLLPLALLGCSKKAADPNPTTDPNPSDTHTRVRVTGTDLTGMGAYIKSSFKMDYRSSYPYESTPVDNSITTPDYSFTYDMGVREKKDFVAAEIGFRTVDIYNTARPRPTTHLKVEILVNGKVVQETELNSSLTGRNVRFNPKYLQANLICKLDSI
ncbi:hypothetical protein [Hymenobacter segetis]|uniref:Lipoprotein n=1 Tax=Hymenobacter segetis TaxID=2025509 RepID=A0ABU9LT03_9BACT